MKILFPILLCILAGCSNLLPKTPRKGKTTYAYVDASGRYTYTREHRLLKNRIITRTLLHTSVGNVQKLLEKSVMVSELGSVKEKNHRAMVVRPFGSEFTVWLEGKKYESKMRMDTKTKSMQLDLSSPDPKWQGKSLVKFPKGKMFCFFSQIPDCLYHNLFLSKALDRKGETLSFYVVWDSYPFLQEQFSGIGLKLFAPAVVKYEGEKKSILNYTVEVDGQTILYHFSKSFDLVRMLWIAQGISIIPPHEEMMTEVEE